MDGDALRPGRQLYRSDIALVHASQTLVVLHLRAQGLGEGDEHPLYALLVEYGKLCFFLVEFWLTSVVNFSAAEASRILRNIPWQNH